MHGKAALRGGFFYALTKSCTPPVPACISAYSGPDPFQKPLLSIKELG